MLKTCQKHLCILSLFLLLFPLVSTLHAQVQEVVISDDGKIKSTYYDDGILAIQKWYGEDDKLDSLKTYYKSGELNEVFYYQQHKDKPRVQGLAFKFNTVGEKTVTWEFNSGKLVERTDHILEFNKQNEEIVKATHEKLKVLNEKIALNPKNIKLRYQRANNRIRLGNYTLALESLQKIAFLLSKDKVRNKLPKKLPGHLYDNLAVVYAHYEMERHVIHYRLKAIDASPNDSRLYNNLGAFLVISQDYFLSIEYLEKTIEMYPNHAFANWGLGVAFSEMGKYKKALEHINNAFQHEKAILKYGKGHKENVRDIRTTRGFIYHKLGESEKGIIDLEEAIEINNNNSFALKNLGIIHYDLENYTTACELLTRAQELGYEKIFDRDDLQPYLDAACEEKNLITISTIKDQPYVYPNPVQDNVYIKNLDINNFNFIILNYESKLLKSGIATGESINFTGFPSGIYILELEKDAVQHIFKVVKQ